MAQINMVKHKTIYILGTSANYLLVSKRAACGLVTAGCRTPRRGRMSVDSQSAPELTRGLTFHETREADDERAVK